MLAVGGRVVDPHHHPVRHLAGARRSLLLPHVGDDHRAALTDAELRAMALADAHPLGEPERRLEPGNRLADVGIDEHRNDGCRRDRAIGSHRAPPGCPQPESQVRCLVSPDQGKPLEVDPPGQLVEQPHAVTEQDGNEVDLDLVHEPRREQRVRRFGAHHDHRLPVGGRPGLGDGAHRAVGDEGERAALLRDRRLGVVGEHETWDGIGRVLPLRAGPPRTSAGRARPHRPRRTSPPPHRRSACEDCSNSHSCRRSPPLPIGSSSDTAGPATKPSSDMLL